MHDVMVELKQLRLHGMAAAWADLVEQRLAALQAQRGPGEEADQGQGAGPQDRPGAGRNAALLIDAARGASRYGLRPSRLAPRNQHINPEANERDNHLLNRPVF
jgi:hypothetical protein